MKKGAILSSTIIILEDIIFAKRKANHVLRNYFRNKRFIGAKDKKNINNLVFRYMKNFFSLKKICKSKKIKFSIRNSLLIYFFNEYPKNNLEDIYKGKYSLQPCKEDDKIFTVASSIKEKIIPSFPEWIKENISDSRKNCSLLLESLLIESKLDVRIDRNLYSRNNIINELNSLQIKARKSNFSPIGITLEKRIPEHLLKKIKKDRFEIQDEGSQIMTLLAKAKPGKKILDYCAGRGTKSLTLYNEILKRDGLYVYEKEKFRLNFLKKRIDEVKAKNIKVLEDLGSYKNFFDTIVLDVPCSGTGVWRRKPENLIHLDKMILDKYKTIQKNILRKSLDYCKIGGHIVYITCSILEEENEDQVKKFVLENTNIDIIDLKDKLLRKIANDNSEKIKWFTLMPNILMSDGYFICIMRKNNI